MERTTTALTLLDEAVRGLACLACQCRYVAVETPGAAERPTMCSSVRQVLFALQFAPRGDAGSGAADARTAALAQVSVRDRVAAMLASWLHDANRCGQYARLFCSLRIARAWERSASNELSPASRASVVHHVLSTVFDRTRRCVAKCQSTIAASFIDDRPASSQRSKHDALLLVLARVCSQYHDGELCDIFVGSGGTTCEAISESFLISVSNHASLLACAATASLLEQLHACDGHENWLVCSLRQRTFPRRCGVCGASLRRVVQQMRSVGAGGNDARPGALSPIKCIAIPFPVGPHGAPRVVDGLAWWLAPPRPRGSETVARDGACRRSAS